MRVQEEGGTHVGDSSGGCSERRAALKDAFHFHFADTLPSEDDGAFVLTKVEILAEIVEGFLGFL